MAIVGMENEEGEQLGSTPHSNIYLYQWEDDNPSVMQECYDLFNERYPQPVMNFVSGGFKEISSPPIYDNYEDDKLEDEGPKWDFTSCCSTK